MQVSNIPTDHSSIIEGINEVYGLVTQTIQTVEVDLFNQPYGEKWSIAENVEHLIMSSFPVASGLKKNKFILKALGKPAAPELTYEELLQKYTLRISQAGVRATPKFTPESKVYDKDEILHNWKTIQNKLSSRLAENWRDKDLDKYTFPHPVLGKLSVRQMMFFTILHTLHHFKAIQKIIEND